jgi:DNA-3-methyladenine glycosylase I
VVSEIAPNSRAEGGAPDASAAARDAQAGDTARDARAGETAPVARAGDAARDARERYTAPQTRERAAAPGTDGRRRCPWGLAPPEYLAYHDEEWGRPVTDDQGMFERLCLEAFQAGLSWLTILRKRPNFRSAFRGFDIEAVAAFGPDDVRRLLADQGIVRNRAKIEAAIVNARVALDLPGGLAAAVWRYADPATPAPRTLADIPATTPGSIALSRELRRHGFRFVGPTTAYATLQACGLVDDHLEGCFRRGAYAEDRRQEEVRK